MFYGKEAEVGESKSVGAFEVRENVAAVAARERNGKTKSNLAVALRQGIYLKAIFI